MFPHKCYHCGGSNYKRNIWDMAVPDSYLVILCFECLGVALYQNYICLNWNKLTELYSLQSDFCVVKSRIRLVNVQYILSTNDFTIP